MTNLNQIKKELQGTTKYTNYKVLQNTLTHTYNQKLCKKNVTTAI